MEQDGEAAKRQKRTSDHNKLEPVNVVLELKKRAQQDEGCCKKAPAAQSIDPEGESQRRVDRFFGSATGSQLDRSIRAQLSKLELTTQLDVIVSFCPNDYKYFKKIDMRLGHSHGAMYHIFGTLEVGSITHLQRQWTIQVHTQHGSSLKRF